MTTFAFAFEPRVARWGRPFGVSPGSAHVDVTGDDLVARFGPWIVTTTVGNVRQVTTTGPYKVWRVAGPARWSVTDRGLTFATSTGPGLCIEFVEPVRGIEPTGLLRHPTLTVTVADMAALARALGTSDPIPHVDLSTGSFRGVALALWRHLRRSNAEETTSATADVGPPSGGAPAERALPVDAQPAETGVGPWFHRRYRVVVERPTITATALMAEVEADPNVVTDRTLAPFVKEVGADRSMAVGDRFTVTTAGPGLAGGPEHSVVEVHSTRTEAPAWS